MRKSSYRFQKKILAVLSCVLALVLVLSVIGYHVVYTGKVSSSKEYKAAGDTSVTYGDDMYLSSDGRIPVFRPDARFKIIELVPYHGMAELGYTIDGEEPITYDNISDSDWATIAQFTQSSENHQNTTESDPLYYDSENRRIVSQNQFIKTTLKVGLELSNAEVEDYIENNLVDVLVLEPSQLNAHPELIDEANMVYIHNNLCDGFGGYGGNVVNIYQKYSKEFMTTSASIPNGSIKFQEGCDISYQVAKKLFYFSCVEKNALVQQGCDFDSENLASLNINKLALFLVMEEYFVDTTNQFTPSELYRVIQTLDPSNDAKTKDENNSDYPLWTYKGLGYEFSKQFMDTITETDESKRKQLVWDLKHKLASDLVNLKADLAKGQLIGEIDTTTLVSTEHGNGIGSLISSKMGDTNHLNLPAAPCSEILNNTQDISIAIRNGRKPLMVVLDLEPDNSFSLTYQHVVSWILENEVVYKITIVQMTMSEFIGNLDDINAEYDLIYLGNSRDRMKEGKIYYTPKDLPAAASELAEKQENSGEFLYSGNDITNKKADELKSYLNAGLPVVYESNISKESQDTNVASFLSSNAGYSNLFQVTDKVISKKIAKSYIDKGKAEIFLTGNNEVQEYTEEKGTAVGASGLNGLSFNTRNGSSDSSYRAYLYVDTNHDGVYNSWTKDADGSWSLNDYGGGIWSADVKASTAVTVAGSVIPETAMLGVVSWKLEVVKLESGKPTGIRTNITGNVYCGANDEESAKPISVLQLGDSENGLNLEENSCYKKVSEENPIVRKDFDITTTFQDIREPLGDVDFENYDVIVVGFLDPDKNLDSADVLLKKLNEVLAKGKGVIFTKDALSFFNNASLQKWGISTNRGFRDLLGLDAVRVCGGKTGISSLDMAFTYSVLNQFSNASYFSGLKQEMQDTNQVTMANSAKIARYPYIISEKNTDGFATSGGIYQADLEAFDGNILKEGKAYYCLSDDGEGNYSVSPNDVRNNYYLWRHDTVFYSGVTKETFLDTTHLNEQKLFVNTLISAYGLERGIYLKVTNLPEITGTLVANSYLMYVDADYDDVNLSGTQDITFTLSQKGLSDPDIELKFYRCNGDGEIETNPISVSMETDGKTIQAESGGGKTVDVKAEKEYTFSYPLEYLNVSSSNDKYHIIIEANVKGSADISDESLVQVLRRSMFDLD